MVLQLTMFESKSKSKWSHTDSSLTMFSSRPLPMLSDTNWFDARFDSLSSGFRIVLLRCSMRMEMTRMRMAMEMLIHLSILLL